MTAVCSIRYIDRCSNTVMYWVLEFSGPGSVVGMATGYGLDGPGFESRWGGEISRTCPDRPWGTPSLLYNGYRVFPGGKKRPVRDANPSPPSSAVVMKEYNYTSTPPMGCTAVQSLSACTRVHFTLTSAVAGRGMRPLQRLVMCSAKPCPCG